MGEFSWMTLFIFGLAAFRLTRLIVADTITSWLRQPFIKITTETNEDGEEEEFFEPNGWIGEGITCQWCAGVWTSVMIIILYVFVPFGHWIVLVLAIAGLQSILYGLSERYL